MIIEISVAVIAIAVVALVIYLIAMSKALQVTLSQVNQTLVDVRKQLDERSGQVEKVIEHTNQISFDLKCKMEALNPIFNAVANLGEILEHKTITLKKKVLVSSDEESDQSDLDSEQKKKQFWNQELIKIANILDILELAGLGIRLWQKIKKRR